MIVVDASAVVAIWENEPHADELLMRLLEDPENERRISAASYIEAGTVLAGRRTRNLSDWPRQFGEWIEQCALELVPVDAEQARIALEARIRYGRGFRHGAKLNFGDCFSYALAKTLSAPLLYVGDDFAKTDIVSALARKRHSKKDDRP